MKKIKISRSAIEALFPNENFEGVDFYVTDDAIYGIEG